MNAGDGSDLAYVFSAARLWLDSYVIHHDHALLSEQEGGRVYYAVDNDVLDLYVQREPARAIDYMQMFGRSGGRASTDATADAESFAVANAISTTQNIFAGEFAEQLVFVQPQLEELVASFPVWLNELKRKVAEAETQHQRLESKLGPRFRAAPKDSDALQLVEIFERFAPSVIELLADPPVTRIQRVQEHVRAARLAQFLASVASDEPENDDAGTALFWYERIIERAQASKLSINSFLDASALAQICRANFRAEKMHKPVRLALLTGDKAVHAAYADVYFAGRLELPSFYAVRHPRQLSTFFGLHRALGNKPGKAVRANATNEALRLSLEPFFRGLLERLCEVLGTARASRFRRGSGNPRAPSGTTMSPDDAHAVAVLATAAVRSGDDFRQSTLKAVDGWRPSPTAMHMLREVTDNARKRWRRIEGLNALHAATLTRPSTSQQTALQYAQALGTEAFRQAVEKTTRECAESINLLHNIANIFSDELLARRGAMTSALHHLLRSTSQMRADEDHAWHRVPPMPRLGEQEGGTAYMRSILDLLRMERIAQGSALQELFSLLERLDPATISVAHAYVVGVAGDWPSARDYCEQALQYTSAERAAVESEARFFLAEVLRHLDPQPAHFASALEQLDQAAALAGLDFSTSRPNSDTLRFMGERIAQIVNFHEYARLFAGKPSWRKPVPDYPRIEDAIELANDTFPAFVEYGAEVEGDEAGLRVCSQYHSYLLNIFFFWGVLDRSAPRPPVDQARAAISERALTRLVEWRGGERQVSYFTRYILVLARWALDRVSRTDALTALRAIRDRSAGGEPAFRIWRIDDKKLSLGIQFINDQ